MLNKITIMGRITADPELRHTTSGTAVTSFSIACDRDRKAENGERPVDFLDVVAWRGTAEFATKYFQKGRMAVISGSLQTRNWTDKDGNKRKAVEIVADSIYFGDIRSSDRSKKDSGDSQSVAPSALPSVLVDDFEEISIGESDLPF